jgi:putative ABC transport system substrate-binding protein
MKRREASVSGKWLGMLKEIEPQLARTAFVVDPKTAPYYDFWMRGAKSVAPSFAIEPVLVAIEDDATDIKRAIAAFANDARKGGLVVPGDSTTNAHRDLSSSRSRPSIACRRSTQTNSSSPKVVS